MWIFTRYGFYSIACASRADGSSDPETVMIRARRAAHLQNLQRRFPALATAEINSRDDCDYRYRLIVPKDLWAETLAALAREQNWSNFKDQVAEFNGPDGYVSALHEVWSVMHRLQRSEESRP